MKKFICFIVVLLLTHSDKCNSTITYHAYIVFTTGQVYEEYFNAPYLEILVRQFLKDSSIESVSFSKHPNYVHKTDID